MEIKSFVSTSKTGAIVPGAKVYVYKQGTTTLADLYNRAEAKITNPLISDTSGFFEFAADNGGYDIQFELSDGSKGVLFGIAFSDVAGISTNITALDNQVKAQAIQIQAAKDSADDSATKVTQLTTQVSGIDTKVNNMQTDVSKNTSDISSAKTDAADAKSAAATATTSANTANTNITSLSNSINGVANITALRARQPAYDGERVYLKVHTPSALSVFKPEGSGWFVGTKTGAATDDGGYVIKAGTGFWTRDKAIEDLAIGDFGGVADGVTDAQPAFKANLEFLMSNYARLRTGATQNGSTVSGGTSPTLKIKFGPGTYYITPGEYNKYGDKIADGSSLLTINPSGYTAYSNIHFEGVATSSMKQVATTIISDKSDRPVFLLNHRRMTIAGITWDGQQTVAQDVYNSSTNPNGTSMAIGATMGIFNDVASNKQPFLKNECPGGLYARVYNFNAINTGNYTFYILDTLDSVFEGIIGQRTMGPVIQVGWSDPNNQFYGKWDHSTALCIRDSNFLSNMAPVIWAPRCAQAMMRNVWISGPGTTPIDINNGQWNISMLVVEGCTHNPNFWNAKNTIWTYSAATGNGIDTNSPTSGQWYSYPKNPDGSDITGWNNTYDLGSFLLQNHGAYFNCPVISKWNRGIIRGTNNTDYTQWVNVGRFRSSTNGTAWRIRIIGGNFYNTESVQNITSDKLFGESTVTIGKSTNLTLKSSWYSEGGGVLSTDPVYKSQTYNGDIAELWLPIRGRVAEYTIFVESTGLTRSEAGQPSMFDPDGSTQTSSPAPASNYTTIAGRFQFHNGKAGFGANSDLAAITSRTVASATGALNNSGVPVVATDDQWLTEAVMPQPVRFMRVNIAGQELAMPIYAWKPVMTTQNPATLSVATGGTLTLAPVVTEAVSYVWQKSTDGTTWTAISGATSSTYTKASVTSDDAGQYRLAYRSNNGVGGNGITMFGPVTTVTVTS